jgi:hypothetical protein
MKLWLEREDGVAAQLAKIHEVPVIILNIDDKKSLDLSCNTRKHSKYQI